ncbi:hypothetical protein LJC71_00225 [Desulfosarcina sp. OttesenSCG-928-A07]|nr:hypothetical protein [Desulfosarcina sp. OttesenSCG-928-G17]MDL2328165.1 hypothetical protein [Desulfosarcina sp. OttesenSCG-928-A07]
MKHPVRFVFVSIVLFVGLAVLPGISFACGIEGTATRTDGSKVDGTVRVSTSWNSNTAYPRDGYYNLELGDGACGKSVEVFVNGNSIGRRSIPNNGNARVDITMKGSSDTPVR